MTTTRKNYTADEERVLISLLQNHTASEVAHIMGRSASSIRNKACRAGLLKDRPEHYTKPNAPRVYISAPITGHSLIERRAYFARVEAQLNEAKLVPVSPFNNGLPDEASHAEHMKADIMLLLTADAYVQDPISTYSAGCEIETAVADACDIPLIGTIYRGGGVYFYEDKIKKILK